ncbi:hypothetical protein [Caballeronia telluris]|uniref:hypothetical protein n=1 Tax=Caballeronia telluris TaxID=326475 RepID=UPI000A3E6C29|nr:hypothetical protein [Caballeronia telluris]
MRYGDAIAVGLIAAAATPVLMRLDVDLRTMRFFTLFVAYHRFYSRLMNCIVPPLIRGRHRCFRGIGKKLPLRRLNLYYRATPFTYVMRQSLEIADASESISKLLRNLQFLLHSVRGTKAPVFRDRRSISVECANELLAEYCKKIHDAKTRFAVGAAVSRRF